MDRNEKLALLGGGLGLGVLAYLGNRSVNKTVEAVTKAVSTGGQFNARLTGYWPYAAKTAAEKRMEGGLNDRKGKPIITLEQHRSDPSKYPFVSVAGDPAIFPYGQRLSIDQFPGAVFRVVDTGSHFFGSGKVYRAAGREPLDVAVDSSSTKIIPSATATIIPGDHLDKGGKTVAFSKFQGQNVTVGEDIDSINLDFVEPTTAIYTSDVVEDIPREDGIRETTSDYIRGSDVLVACRG